MNFKKKIEKIIEDKYREDRFLSSIYNGLSDKIVEFIKERDTEILKQIYSKWFCSQDEKVVRLYDIDKIFSDKGD